MDSSYLLVFFKKSFQRDYEASKIQILVTSKFFAAKSNFLPISHICLFCSLSNCPKIRQWENKTETSTNRKLRFMKLEILLNFKQIFIIFWSPFFVILEEKLHLKKILKLWKNILVCQKNVSTFCEKVFRVKKSS